MRTRRSEERLREDAQVIFRAALEAVDPAPLVSEALLREDPAFLANKRLSVLGFGKAVFPMARGVDEVLGIKVTGGVLVGPRGGAMSGLPEQYRALTAGHPDPDDASIAGALAVRDWASGRNVEDLLIVLISGGASAMLSLPPESLTVQDVARVISAMSRAGAPIQSLNAVRKHLDQLKGGRLARVCAPSQVLALVLSDVPGDALDVIGSGPLTPDRSTFADALKLVRGLGPAVPDAVIRYLSAGVAGEHDESPGPEDGCFQTVRQIIIGSGTRAAQAAASAAQDLGYPVEVGPTNIVGDVSDVAATLGAWARRKVGSGPACFVSAGEPTVQMTGQGQGGRNQQLVLQASTAIEGVASVLVGSLATDGVDGSTSAAGALATGSTVSRARVAGFDVAEQLNSNDAFPVLKALHDLITTGPTGTNVADIQLTLVG